MINLVIKDVIEDKFFLKGNILNLLKKCRDLVGLFNHSNLLAPKLANVMMKIYEEKPVNPNIRESRPCKLQQDVPTRWNSTFIMLESIDCCKDGITNVIHW